MSVDGMTRAVLDIKTQDILSLIIYLVITAITTLDNMGVEIPEPYLWDERFQVFYGQIDEEHKNLFKAIFDLAKTPDNQQCLSSLISQVVNHFATEEALMQKCNYPLYTGHKAIHDKFVQDAGGLKCPVTQEQILFAKDWLVNHIMENDKKYVGKLG